MENSPRLYSLIAKDTDNKEWQVVMGEDGNTSFEQQSTLTTIDKRTSNFEDQLAFENYLLQTGYRVVSDEVEFIKFGSSNKPIPINKLLVTEKNKPAFSEFLEKKKCRLVKLTPSDVIGFPYIYIINRSNGTVSRSPVVYKNQTELIPVCDKYSQSNTIDINDPIVRNTVRDFVEKTVHGKATRFLFGSDNWQSSKYIDSHMYSLILDYYEDPNLYHERILECFRSYKVFRNAYLGLQAYKMKLNAEKQKKAPAIPTAEELKNPTTDSKKDEAVRKVLTQSGDKTIEDLIKEIKDIANKKDEAPIEKIEWEQPSFFDEDKGYSKTIEPPNNPE